MSPTLRTIPPELRNRIIRFALPDGEHFHYKAASSPLCRTSSQLHFLANDCIPKHLGPEHIQSLRILYVFVKADENGLMKGTEKGAGLDIAVWGGKYMWDWSHIVNDGHQLRMTPAFLSLADGEASVRGLMESIVHLADIMLSRELTEQLPVETIKLS
ncbi:hypothetical protein LTR37_001615 [Vermiconidia calcicola]|uniref:Uncharacterized protein n=1 Tax=Vermiconidia calcicola TaxID=1690605 RepID=A0ACC3NV74_9PEZI|nr:hypothetical protein LTR37_001615 [Vermiconidia calcicola]